LLALLVREPGSQRHVDDIRIESQPRPRAHPHPQHTELSRVGIDPAARDTATARDLCRVKQIPHAREARSVTTSRATPAMPQKRKRHAGLAPRLLCMESGSWED